MSPARRLHETFSRWKQEYVNGVQVAAGARNLEDSAGTDEQILAIEDLSLTIRGLDELAEKGVRHLSPLRPSLDADGALLPRGLENK